MKHFEDLWVESEEYTKLYYNDPVNLVIEKVKIQLDSLINCNDQNKKIEIIGKILLDISFISQKLNIDVYSALKKEIEELKIELFDPE